MPRKKAEVMEFLKREKIASLATVDHHNRPHVVPVWFTYDDGKVHVQTDRKSAKIRNLKKNPNVSVAVYRGEEAVVIHGKACVIKDKGEFVKWTQRHIDKYHIKLDEQGRDAMGIPLFNSKIRCIIEVTPRKVLIW